jgi:hypothetical protein
MLDFPTLPSLHVDFSDESAMSDTGTLVKAATPTVGFPLAAVEAKLREELLGVAHSAADMHSIALPTDPVAQSAAAIQLDSLAVVDVLLSVEQIVGCTLKDHIVKAGGYSSINSAIEHLTPRIKSAWDKHAAKGSKK